MPTSKIKNPFDYLVEDHRKIALLMEAAASGGGAERNGRFSEIKDALALHMELEETAVYPVLKGHEGTRREAMESKEEHRLVRSLVADLSALQPGTDAWSGKFLMLKAAVEHHVNEEEGAFFPKAKKALSREEEEMVRREMARFLGAPGAQVRGRNAMDEDPTEA